MTDNEAQTVPQPPETDPEVDGMLEVADDSQEAAEEAAADFADAFTPADGAEDDTAADDAPEEADEAEPASRREARYRTRLRAAEEELEKLRGTVGTLLSGEAERMAASDLRDGSDLWRDGHTIDDVLDEDGNVDAAKVNELARQLSQAHPHWSIYARPASSGLRSGSSSVQEESRVSGWQKAFTPRNSD